MHGSRQDSGARRAFSRPSKCQQLFSFNQNTEHGSQEPRSSELKSSELHQMSQDIEHPTAKGALSGAHGQEGLRPGQSPYSHVNLPSEWPLRHGENDPRSGSCNTPLSPNSLRLQQYSQARAPSGPGALSQAVSAKNPMDPSGASTRRIEHPLRAEKEGSSLSEYLFGTTSENSSALAT